MEPIHFIEPSPAHEGQAHSIMYPWPYEFEKKNNDVMGR
jgi:hypothetical protein